MHKKFYIFGNPLLDFDSLPIRLIPGLQKEFPEMSFELVDPNENMVPDNGRLYIIDTVINIKAPVLIDNIEDLELSPRYSMHDLDLAFNLKLLKKIGRLSEVYLIGLPPDYPEESGLKETAKIIKKIEES